MRSAGSCFPTAFAESESGDSSSWQQLADVLAESIDILLPYVADFAEYYNTSERVFSYDTAAPSFVLVTESKTWSFQLSSAISLNNDSKQHILINHLIRALKLLPTIEFFAAKRDISMYGECRKKNYLLALAALDKQELAPNEKLNMNRVIAESDERCSDLSYGRPYMFYEWACGASTLLFWNSLLNPHITITKRQAHRHWYPAFYGSEVMWDDAVMYELDKQFEIKNTSESPIYFRTRVSPAGEHVLLSMTTTSEKQKNEYVKITREKLNERQGRIQKDTYVWSDGISTEDTDDKKISSQHWTSRYIWYDLTSDVSYISGRRRLSYVVHPDSR